jgi:3-isopropylmalate dehydrogenase
MLDKAIARSLERGLRTGDIMQDNMRRVSTREMGEAIIGELEVLSG